MLLLLPLLFLLLQLLPEQGWSRLFPLLSAMWLWAGDVVAAAAGPPSANVSL
jgi:hypothetical protein